MAKLFVGLQIPGHLAKQFNLLKIDVTGARWQTEENMHVTLSFIGEVDDGLLNKVLETLRNVEAEQFSLALKSVGTFARHDEPNVLWAGIANADALKVLKRKIDEVLHGADLPFDRKEYRPHMTLAFLETCDRDKLAAFLNKNKDFCCDAFEVSEFVLYQTMGTKEAPVFKRVSTYRLLSKG
jgi:2'-5' RNA ligase